jgi:hypothetical protein
MRELKKYIRRNNMVSTIKVQFDYEDELDIDIITEGMFKLSIIDGVRLYPFIILGDGRKYYLEVLYALQILNDIKEG